ncbi:MAG: putative membrane protein YwzB, partial [Candidatus Midichloriaceae bacterium]
MQRYLNDLTILDIVIVVSHLLICIGIGFYHLKSIKTDKDFCTMDIGKHFPLILICTLFATAIGGGTIIVYIDEICKNPVVLFFIIAQPFYWLITSKVVTQGNCMKFSECQNRLNMVNNKEQMNKEKIDEALRSDRKNS